MIEIEIDPLLELILKLTFCETEGAHSTGAIRLLQLPHGESVNALFSNQPEGVRR